ncbi:CBS domain-containing protein [Halopelagius longus]|uniref:CBS domain-containing protein n=1 Tax=Halopelagius longus TaxID=1236180 RepID=A0A1H0XPX6_9EURY|nr:CBS domain-containing protein [Halopelagius longus]RDI73086.1 CBS domain-containing protein [Halopelagius longus]SDQ04726.1 CBS domain-containing protein [Halopelagius longus]
MLGDLTRTDALTAAPETTVADAAEAMRTRDADIVVVVDENRPLGLLTPETVGRAVVADEDVREMAVGELVGDDPVTVHETADREALVRLFARRDARAAIVVDEGDEYAGVVTFEDLLAAYAREFDALLELAE